jgi:hypothetical protein
MAASVRWVELHGALVSYINYLRLSLIHDYFIIAYVFLNWLYHKLHMKDR